MEQHPVPQHVSSYQFKLVGDMTLRQFFQLAGGAVVSLILYASHLHPLIKWPLVILSAIVGVALAFLPLEDRPLEKWIVAFFKSIYSPTLYSWKRTESPSKFFQDEGAPAPAQAERIIAPGGEAKLQSYLSQTPQGATSFFTKLEEAEKGFLSKITTLFGGAGPTTAPPQAALPTYRPEIGAAVPRQVAQPTPTPQASLYQVAPTLAGPVTPGKEAQFSLQAAPPNPPTIPNTVTGQVMDYGGKIVETAIMEIRDVSGRPVRAFKTNKLGHFITVTPLTDGKYQIITEKEGLVFDPISFEAVGGIIPPIAIKAKTEVVSSPAVQPAL